MSIVTELQKLISWAADLEEKAPPTPDETPLSRHGWVLVSQRMKAASDKFGELSADIESSPLDSPGSGATPKGRESAREWQLIVELARDLRRESQNLELRARVLSLRGAAEGQFEEILGKIAEAELETAKANRDAALARKRGDEAVQAASELQLARQQAEAADRIAAFTQEQAAAFDAPRVGKVPEAPASTKPKVITAKDVIAVAKASQRPIETALEKLRLLEHPDRVALAFGDELDALAESALDLVQRCEHAGDLADGSPDRDG